MPKKKRETHSISIRGNSMTLKGNFARAFIAQATEDIALKETMEKRIEESDEKKEQEAGKK